ncbi:MAG: c-type cytochrome [Planctomycetes bacterium]|nr:c-type cytochrome [Planctomycetota bacterium]
MSIAVLRAVLRTVVHAAIALSVCGGWTVVLSAQDTDRDSNQNNAPTPATSTGAPQPLAPEEAARTMVVPDGFHVTLFAGEPDVQQPIGFCIDDRGRLWVAEAYNYPNHGTRPGDRIIILEDLDGDGRFDKRKVFYDQLNYVTGVEIGFGGVWVMSPPGFYFIPDRDGDDRPDSEPVLLLDGFGNHANSHNLANAVAWGPDGWLYGTHGRTNWSEVGKPGTPDEKRIRFDGGVYRYHPVRHVFEPFADGTTNPWGIDWDDYGQAFVCNCVDPHLYHVIQGAHYEPWRNRESSRYAYQRIATIADHLHFVGKGSIVDGIGTTEEDAAGGGHAHCGTMVYLGDNWPDRYRNTVFMHNLHGRRINNDLLQRDGSGYRASHGADILRAQDRWYMGVTLQYGPDGAVYSSDWSDTGECHSVVNTQRGTGRIYKISYGKTTPFKRDLATLSIPELVDLQSHRNDWHVRHARRLLQERFAAGIDMRDTVAELRRRLADEPSVERRLRLLWALHVTGGADEPLLVALLDDPSEHLRAWAVRLLGENPLLGAGAVSRVERYVHRARSDSSALVCLQLACLLQRLELGQRWELAESLAARGEFDSDRNIPLLLWYGIEPLHGDDLKRYVRLGVQSRIGIVGRHIARRVAAMPSNPTALELLVAALPTVDQPAKIRVLLEGILTGLEGARNHSMPDAWPEIYAALRRSPEEAIQQLSLRLALHFNDQNAIASLRKQATDRLRPDSDRQRAIHALVMNRTPGFDRQLLELLDDPTTRAAAVRGLAEYNHPETARALLELYGTADAALRQEILQTLSARASWARSLMYALEGNRIRPSELSAFTARQIHSLGDKSLSAKVRQLWGQVRETPAERTRLVTQLKQQLTTESLQSANRSRGRALFARSCANCHRLFDSGTPIGPELTGAQRTNLDYLLLNLLDPGSSIAKDYQLQVVTTSDGRVVTGLLAGESDNAITIQTGIERIVVPVSEIEKRSVSGVSMMPEGLLQHLQPDEIRDLFGYLMGPDQVALPAP